MFDNKHWHYSYKKNLLKITFMNNLNYVLLSTNQENKNRVRGGGGCNFNQPVERTTQ